MRSVFTLIILTALQLNAGIGAGYSGNNPLPVELVSFTALQTADGVLLEWKTATEINNFGFQIERTTQIHENWETIGFIKGNGNSNSPKEYFFTDISNNSSVQLPNHSFRYRLKQIDTDGKYTYSKEIEVGSLTPSATMLAQNYPNPFNPSTVISYQITENSQVTLKLYDILGNEVATLVNENKEAGSYNYQLTMSSYSLAGGVYYYTLNTGGYYQVKKMLYLK